MKICPFCGEGPIYKAEVQLNGETIFICAECDTVWQHMNDKIEVTNYTDYMKKLGKSALWDYLKLISAV